MSDETGAVAESVPPAAPAAPTRFPCAISGIERPRKDMMAIEELRPGMAERIRRDYPNLPDGALISRAEITRYRRIYVEEALKEEHGEVTELEAKVASSIAASDTLAENIEASFQSKRTIGEVLADHVASFGGSWNFIIYFAVVMAIWMGYNLAVGEEKAFDAYPFILLNLVLSTLAAIQAPIIMMSQKRQEAKDRMRSLNDFQINLKAELEIQHLHEKIDYMLTKQAQRMAEIQQIQLELLHERKGKKGH